MRRTTKPTPYRPPLTEYLPMLEKMAEKINERALYPFSVLDIVRLSIEELYKRMFPGEELPPTPRRKYYRIDF